MQYKVLNFLPSAGSSFCCRLTIWCIFGLLGWQFQCLEIRRNNRNGWYWTHKERTLTEWRIDGNLGEKVAVSLGSRPGSEINLKYSQTHIPAFVKAVIKRSVQNKKKIILWEDTPKFKKICKVSFWIQTLKRKKKRAFRELTHIQVLLGAGRCSKLFTSNLIFRTTLWNWYYYTICKWGNWSAQKGRNLLNITKLVTGRDLNPAVWVQRL